MKKGYNYSDILSNQEDTDESFSLAEDSLYRRNQSILHVKSKKFAVRIIKLIKHLDNDWRLAPLYNQILRSGTSIHANVRESEFAQSSSDFISKLSISLKEANETVGWLELFLESECIHQKAYDSLVADCNEIIALLVSSIKTAKINQNIVK